MSARHVDRAIEALARTQHGVFARRQALLRNATSSLIDRRLASGAWLRLAPGVYALPGNPPTWRRQLKAAELSVVEGAVCGAAAAGLHSLTGYRPARPEIVVPPTTSARNQLALVRRYDPGRLTTVDGIRVVSAAQALVDVAPRSSPRRLGRALDDLVVGDSAELDLVRARYLAARGRAGLRTLHGLLAERGDGYLPTESELEVALRALFARPELPPATWQAPLPWLEETHVGPRRRQRVDALVEPWAVIVEADGRRWHTRVVDFERDHDRDLEALRHGYVIARFTWAQLTGRPDECVDILLEVGADRRQHRRPAGPEVMARHPVRPPPGSGVRRTGLATAESVVDTWLNSGWNRTVAGLSGPGAVKCDEIPH
jgi:hypothetical protein